MSRFRHLFPTLHKDYGYTDADAFWRDADTYERQQKQAGNYGSMPADRITSFSMTVEESEALFARTGKSTNTEGTPISSTVEVLINNETSTVTEGEKGGKRYQLWGHNITGVIRWMGKEGWNKAQATKALVAYSIECSPSTVTAQLSAGVKGERGEPAPLTTEQMELLRKARE